MKKLNLEVFDQEAGCNTGDIVEVMVDLDGFQEEVNSWNLEILSDVYAQYVDEDYLQVCCEVSGRDPGSMQYTKLLTWERLLAP